MNTFRRLILLFSLFFSLFYTTALWGQQREQITVSKKSQKWKLGLSLYTFSNVSFPEQLMYADSCGLKYIEGFVFAKAGTALKDSFIVQLSPKAISTLKQEIDKKKLKMESIYIIGGKKVADWKRDFEIAKNFGVKYVTAEPPRNLWDSVDSLAHIYGIKVALHNHWKETSIYWHPDSVLVALKGHPNFGACPDLGHYPKSGIDPIDAIKKLKGRMLGVHLKDINEYNNNKIQDVTLGTGIINFPLFFTELKKQKFNGYLIIERDTKEQPSNLQSVIKSIKYINEQNH